MNISEINTNITQNNNLSKSIETKVLNPQNNVPSKSTANNSANQITHAVKEALISTIPIYGTIQEFKKGEIRWGIFGAVTDVLLLVPVLGCSAKLIGSLARGAKVAKNAIEIGKTGYVASKVIHGGNIAIKTTTAATEKIHESETIIKNGTISAEYINHVEKKANAALETSNIIDKKIKRSTEELRFKESTAENIHAPKYSSDPTFHQITNPNILKRLSKLGDNFFRDFRIIKYSANPKPLDRLYKKLNDAGKASEFIVDGKNITSNSPENILNSLEKIFPNDFDKIQLISTFAHEGIFDKPFTHKIPPIDLINNYKHVLSDGKTSYNIKTMNNGNLEFTAKYESNVIRGNVSPKTQNKFGVKVSTELSKNKAPELKYAYYYV
ncbi:MAG: hypothetical protein C4617_02915 [Candidatus Liberibacter europaeus]|uniref:Uncharacterized protein n=1 Tax=Candidatus Liberibacter europaeus TaxID=744859 RepID=A0A2T4VYC8_9HYPH|nr:hypothetical protein [Candidatus Liberibacter europaeus]PTL86771.1 MAG: hypothetical protein C4617_02915 [Candidatus Liberibacter europaeus]